MKLTLTLLLVCASVMVSTAVPLPAQDISSTGIGTGKEAYAGSATYEDKFGRGSSGYGEAKEGVALSESRNYYIPEEVKQAIRARIEARYGPLPQNPPQNATPKEDATPKENVTPEVNITPEQA